LKMPKKNGKKNIKEIIKNKNFKVSLAKSNSEWVRVNIFFIFFLDPGIVFVVISFYKYIILSNYAPLNIP